MTSPEYVESIRQRIDDARTHDIPYYNPTFDYQPDHGTTHLNVLAPDGAAVAMTSTINFLSVTTSCGRAAATICLRPYPPSVGSEVPGAAEPIAPADRNVAVGSHG